MMLTRAIWLLVGLNVVLFVFAVWATRQEGRGMDEAMQLKEDKLYQLWGESEPHASGDICLNCERLATADGFPWCDQCFLEEQGKYLALMAEMWKAKTDRLKAEAEGLRRWLAEGEIALTETNAENARIAGEYQGAADEVCAALGVEWTAGNRYPTVAVEAIEQLQARSSLVTLELAELLVLLANAVDTTQALGLAQMTYTARSTASRIREVNEANEKLAKLATPELPELSEAQSSMAVLVASKIEAQYGIDYLLAVEQSQQCEDAHALAAHLRELTEETNDAN